MVVAVVCAARVCGRHVRQRVWLLLQIVARGQSTWTTGWDYPRQLICVDAPAAARAVSKVSSWMCHNMMMI